MALFVPSALWAALLPLLLITTKATGFSFSLNVSLSTNQTWLSENSTFTLGFHPIPETSASLYLAVWYSGVPVVPVWLMHREKPVSAGATLQLTNVGNLVVEDEKGAIVFTSNTSALGVVGGRFLENGNVVLVNGNGQTVWDSFDYPTDTFLPGLVVQVGHKFTSWISPSDPSPGLYTFEIIPSGELHFLYNHSQLYYNSGPWSNSTAHYTNPPQLGRTTPPDVFHYDTSTGSPRVWYTTSGRSVTNDITLKRMRLDPDGVARQYIWVIDTGSWQTFISAPVEPCDSWRVCGANSVCKSSTYVPVCECLPGYRAVNEREWRDGSYWLQGCEREAVCQGNETSVTSFMALGEGSTVEADLHAQVYLNDTESSCREKCSQNCSCSGYSFTDTTCTLHSPSSVVYNARASNASVSPFFLRFQATPSEVIPGGSKGGSSTKGIVIAVLVSFVGVVLVGALLWWLWRAKQRGKGNSKQDFSAVGVMRFSYKELVDATGNFGKQLGSGGFGTVHKGTLGDKSEVAVKTLAKLRQGEQEFRTEVAVIGTVQHINLVRLRGFCAEGDHRALVYEFITNGSLERFLFTKSDEKQQRQVLDWPTRMAIALGAARGIAYLHHECRSSIIHCDIKPENILLTADFTPKVSDFGLAKLLGKDVSRVITNIRGTRGYLAPEWLTNCTLTSKVDVYSFGMTLLELISGRRTVDLSLPSEKCFYAVWAFKELNRGQSMATLVDERLFNKESMDEGELRRMLQVGLWCTQDDPEKRPTMRDVVKMLEGTLEVQDAPAPPSYAQTSDEGFHSGHAALFQPGKGSGDQDMNKISFEYTQTFSAR